MTTTKTIKLIRHPSRKLVDHNQAVWDAIREQGLDVGKDVPFNRIYNSILPYSNGKPYFYLNYFTSLGFIETFYKEDTEDDTVYDMKYSLPKHEWITDELKPATPTIINDTRDQLIVKRGIYIQVYKLVSEVEV